MQIQVTLPPVIDWGYLATTLNVMPPATRSSEGLKVTVWKADSEMAKSYFAAERYFVATSEAKIILDPVKTFLAHNPDLSQYIEQARVELKKAFGDEIRLEIRMERFPDDPNNPALEVAIQSPFDGHESFTRKQAFKKAWLYPNYEAINNRLHFVLDYI